MQLEQLSLSQPEALRVGGFVPLTSTDFPGQLAAVVFCQGCPWKCYYCHNPHLIPTSGTEQLAWKDVFAFLQKRVGLLDGVVFSGGEPTMQKGVVAAAQTVKTLGLKVGLHTAGQYPKRLEELMPHLDWVGMDMKAPFGKFEQITRRQEQCERQRRSITLLVNSKINYELRTTFHPCLLKEEDLLAIRDDLTSLGVKNFALQLFRKNGCTDQKLLQFPVGAANVSAGIRRELKDSFDMFVVREF